MTTTATAPLSATPPNAQRAGASEIDESQLNLLSRLSGLRGLTAFAAASQFWAVVTVLERGRTVKGLYPGAGSVLVHFAAEAVSGAFIALAAWAMTWLLRVPVTHASRSRWLARGWSVGLALCFSVFLYGYFVARSTKAHVLPTPIWLLGFTIVGWAVLATITWILAGPVRRRTWMLGPVAGLAAAALHIWALRVLTNTYGNAHVILLIIVVWLGGLAAAVCLPSERVTRVVGYASAGIVGAATLCLLLLTPSNAQRKAVLLWGGAAKRVTLNVLWRIADVDRDGVPSRFWGTDTNDSDASTIVSRTRLTRVDTPPTMVPKARGVNVLWILFDTLRADTFDRVLAEKPAVREFFSEFAAFEGFSSCSSRTDQTVMPLLGRDTCDALQVTDSLRGAPIGVLRSAGFRDEHLGYFRPYFRFTKSQTIKDDSTVIQTLRERLETNVEASLLLFVHLRGGHTKSTYAGPSYDGIHSTLERDAYERQVEKTLEKLARSLTGLLRDDWVVLFMGDHGEAFDQHHTSGHGTTLYEEVLRTPFLLRSRAWPAGRYTESIGCPDVVARLYHALGLIPQRPEPLGFQFAATDILRGEFGQLQNMGVRSLRTGDLKTIYFPELGIWEHYNLNDDPGEQRDLSETSSTFTREKQRMESLVASCAPPVEANMTRERLRLRPAP